MKLGSSLIIHNAVEYDYCVELAIRSLMPVVDELVVLDAESTDTTAAILCGLVSEFFPRITIVSAPWTPNPGGMGSWLADLSNLAKSHLGSDCTHHLALQADEVLEECHVPAFRNFIEAHPCTLQRLNFWIDHQHIAPPDRVCSSYPTRCVTIDARYGGDAESLVASNPRPLVRPRIFHYGFIRHPKQFVAKSIPTQKAFFGGETYDPCLHVIETDPRKGFESHLPLSQCRPFHDAHPAAARSWLRERGYIA